MTDSLLNKEGNEAMDELVDRFLTWPVPASVYPDGTPGQPGRTGTNLLSAIEAKAMLEHVIGPWLGEHGALILEVEQLKMRLSDEQRRLRRFAEMAAALEGKGKTFGGQLAADRELGFLREHFLGELAKGADAYTAFCRAIDSISDKPLPEAPK